MKGTDHEWGKFNMIESLVEAVQYAKVLKVVLSNSLFTTHPEVAKEWHSTKNGDISQRCCCCKYEKKLVAVSNSKEHEWCAIIDNRTRKGYGCPECGIKLHISEMKLFEIVKKYLLIKKLYIDIDQGG